MAYIPCMAKPMKSLELYHSMVPFLINIIVDRQGLVVLIPNVLVWCFLNIIFVARGHIIASRSMRWIRERFESFKERHNRKDWFLWRWYKAAQWAFDLNKSLSQSASISFPNKSNWCARGTRVETAICVSAPSPKLIKKLLLYAFDNCTCNNIVLLEKGARKLYRSQSSTCTSRWWTHISKCDEIYRFTIAFTSV